MAPEIHPKTFRAFDKRTLRPRCWKVGYHERLRFLTLLNQWLALSSRATRFEQEAFFKARCN